MSSTSHKQVSWCIDEAAQLCQLCPFELFYHQQCVSFPLYQLPSLFQESQRWSNFPDTQEQKGLFFLGFYIWSDLTLPRSPSADSRGPMSIDGPTKSTRALLFRTVSINCWAGSSRSWPWSHRGQREMCEKTWSFHVKEEEGGWIESNHCLLWVTLLWDQWKVQLSHLKWFQESYNHIPQPTPQQIKKSKSR